ncbi:MAG: ThiF family adenylyltransferase [Phycisphaerales bacterium]|nr:MAG: ThiF family adenylyltransferase [Phycisphaerales bacterium]
MKASKSPSTRLAWPRLPPVSRATVIGLGGIGRQVALQLAALGVRRLQLVDARAVTPRARRQRGYAYEDIGRPMVHAVAHACHQVHPKLDIETVRRRSLRGLHLGDAVFCCSGSVQALRALSMRAGDDTLVLACCHVRGPVIHCSFTRAADALADWPDAPLRSVRGSRLYPPSAMPIHITTLAAGLLVAEFARFAATGRTMRSIRKQPMMIRSSSGILLLRDVKKASFPMAVFLNAGISSPRRYCE